MVAELFDVYQIRPIPADIVVSFPPIRLIKKGVAHVDNFAVKRPMPLGWNWHTARYQHPMNADNDVCSWNGFNRDNVR